MHEFPVPAERVLREYWIREVPYDKVPKLGLDVPSIINADLLLLITGYVIKELQDNATVDRAHILLHNLSVVDNRDNDRFLSLVKSTAIYVALRIERKTDDESVESIVRECAITCVALAVARLLHEFPSLVPYPHTAAFEEYENVLELGNQIQTEVKISMYGRTPAHQYSNTSHSTHQHPNHQHQPYQHQQPQYFKAADGRTGEPITEDGTGIILYTDGQQLFHPNQLGITPEVYMGYQPPQQQHRQQYNPNPQPYNNHHPHPAHVNRNPIVRNMGGAMEEWGSADATRHSETPTVGRGIVTAHTRVGSTDTPNTPARTTVAKNAPEAHKTTTLWNRTDSQPYPLCYDPTLTTLHHVKNDDDVVIHEIRNRTEAPTVDYLLHELRPALRSKHKRDLEMAKTRIARQERPLAVLDHQADFSALIVDKASEIAALTATESLLLEDVIYMDGDGIVCTSIADGINKVEQQLRIKRVSTRNAFNFNALATSSLILTAVDQDMLDQIKTGEQDFLAISDILSMALGRADKPSRFWYVVTEMLMHEVNRCIKYGLGSAITISNFAEDATKIIDFIEKALGVTAADLLRRLQADIIFKVFNNITVSLPAEGELTATITDKIMVTVLPVTALELKVNFDKNEYGVITHTRFPALHPVLLRMVAGLEFVDRAVLVTSDNVVLEIYKGLLVPNAILVSL